MIWRRLLVWLVCAALVLPMITLLLLAVARLLAAMQDLAGSAVLDRLALAAGLLWGFSLVGLIVVQALHSLQDLPPDEPLE